MNPLISVVVPVYNGQGYLEKCIDSIVNQNYSSIEILIVNDGSTDETPAICDALVEKHNDSVNGSRTIRVIKAEGKGVSVARNIGIENASGEYMTFIDADDRVMPDMLQVLYDNMISSDSDVSGCQFIKWSSDDEWDNLLQSSTVKDKSFIMYSDNEFANRIISGNSRCWSKLYKRSVITESKVGFPEDLTIGEDMLFLAELTKHGAKFCESHYQGYGYYLNNTGAMNKKFTPKSMDQIYCWERARDVLGSSSKLDSIILISVLLTVGRIAVLNKSERQQFSNEIKIAHNTLRKYYRKEAKSLLDSGYKIKTIIFKLSPKLYMNMYSLWKR